MGLEQLFLAAVGFLLSIVSYFLKTTIDELKEVKNITYENKTKIQMVEVDYLNKLEHHNQKITDLNVTMKDLILEIKALRDKIH